jgi:hypothetical protein
VLAITALKNVTFNEPFFTGHFPAISTRDARSTHHRGAGLVKWAHFAFPDRSPT